MRCGSDFAVKHLLNGSGAPLRDFMGFGLAQPPKALRDEKSGANAPPLFSGRREVQAARAFIAFKAVIAPCAWDLVMKRRLDIRKLRNSHLFNSPSPS